MFFIGIVHSFLLFHLIMNNGNNSSGNRTTPTGVTKKKPTTPNKPNGKSNNNNGRPGGGGSNTVKLTGKEKKLGKRALQLAAMEKKAEAEDAYFRQCQRDAQRQNRAQQSTVSAAREVELFGTQGAQGINFGKYDDIQVEVKLPHTTSADSKKKGTVAMKHFDDLTTLDAALKRNIERMRYATPTPIQRHAIPQAMDGQDLLCCAQTGSGKTCAFLLPICAALSEIKPQQVNNNGNGAKTPCSPRCIVLAPTRELAIQIELEAQKLTYGMQNVRPVTVYGGANQRKQLRDLAFGADIVVATPGRLTDFVERNIVSLANCQYLILDEADRMLDMGFEVRYIIICNDFSVCAMHSLVEFISHCSLYPRFFCHTIII
jgi:hypothetical protein